MPEHKVVKHSVTIAGHRTSISLEQPFWDSLKHIADERGISMNCLISEIDEQRPSNLSSALRIHVLRYYQKK